MNTKKSFLTIALLGISAIGASALNTPGIEVDHLGVNNTLVRVNPDDARYLIIPVQESNDDATLNVLVDGKIEKTIYVRLAKSKVDYSVPLDLSAYKGHDVVLNILTSQSRSSIRDVKDDACWNNLVLSDTFDTSNHETKYRPSYHHTPLYGWMNDPNGMVYKDGKWHLYYQYNPYGSKWQNMTWGHSSSEDLVNWEHHPLAIEPNGLGSVFSGSSVLDPQNTSGFGSDAIVSLYTSAGASQIQSLAWSKDNGETFEIYPGNPVITLETEARDPNMFWNKETGEWVLLLAHALEHEMLFYTSPDLKNWTLASSFGKGLGCQDGVWECPDFFKLPVNGTDEEKWMLICNINPGGPFGGSAAQYFIGDFDGKKFTPDLDKDGNVPTKWLDFGKDNYATVSWSDAPDDRRVVIGWMSNWQYAAEVPTLQYRSANTLPREVSLFKGNDGQIYAATTPSPELNVMRQKPTVKVGRTGISAKGKKYSIPELCEIELDLRSKKGAPATLTLSNDNGEKVVITYNPEKETVTFDRTESGVIDFSQDFPVNTTAPTFGTDGQLSLRIYIDRSSIEVFGNDGRFAMTNLVFPNSPYTTLSISAGNGGAEVRDLTVYPLATNK